MANLPPPRPAAPVPPDDAASNPMKTGQHPAYQFLRRNWAEYLAEILVIILGVTLSFAVDEWREENHKRELEQRYLKSLLNDLTSDTEELRDIIAETREVLRNAQRLLALGETEHHPFTSPDSLAHGLREVSRRPNFLSKDATFTDLRSSGNAQIIRDFELKSALFDYYKHYESIKAIEMAERESMHSLFAPYLIKRLSLRQLATLPSHGTNAAAVRAVLRDPEFSNILVVRLLNREELLDEYASALVYAQRLRAQLKQKIRD